MRGHCAEGIGREMGCSIDSLRVSCSLDVWKGSCWFTQHGWGNSVMSLDRSGDVEGGKDCVTLLSFVSNKPARSVSMTLKTLLLRRKEPLVAQG